MSQASDYAIAPVHADSYRLDRTTPPGQGAAAFVIRGRDRLGNPLGWKLKPLVTMQGARSRVWPAAPDAPDALASTKLMTARQAQAAIDAADAAATGEAR